MNEKTTERLDKILHTININDFTKYSNDELGEALPSLSDYLNECIAKRNLLIADVVKRSGLSRDYAYAILNGNRKNPTKDRIIALCLAIGLNLTETQRALKLCGMVLYSKNKRDAAIIICINTEIYDIAQVNDFLISNELDVLETSKM
jgi:transcriptional regulator with XRE-family HTH domain